ncbi:hypothetical protein Tco_0322746 [Tanacetum coccineum]
MQQQMPNFDDISDLTTAMNMALVLMAKAFKLNYSTPTNNNQRTSSNPQQTDCSVGYEYGTRQTDADGWRKWWESNVRNQVGKMQFRIQNANQNGNGNVVGARAEGNGNGNNINQNDKSEVVYAKCKKCLITANHDVCLLNYVNDMNSYADNQNANVSNVTNQNKHKPKVKKPKKSESQESFATPKPRKPRIFLRWSPTERTFYLKGKLIESSDSEYQSNCSKGDNACTYNPQEPTSKRFPNSTSFLGRFLGTVRFGNDHVAVILGLDNTTKTKSQPRSNTKRNFSGTPHASKRTARFGNDHVAVILGYGDLQWGNILIARALCCPKNDHEAIGKLGAKGDIGFFVGYSTNSCAYTVYNRRTKKIMETMNVTFDELLAMAFEQRSLKPELQGMTSRQITMYDDYIGGQPSADTRPDPATPAP